MGDLREVFHAAALTLHPPPDALYTHTTAYRFPPMETTSLLNEASRLDVPHAFGGRWTLLGCAGSNFAQPMVDGWLTGVAGALQERGGAAADALQLRWLSLIERAALGWFARPLLATMRMSIPAERHAAFSCRFGETTDLRADMQMPNRYLGFVCLIDGAGLVRWHVHGNEEPTGEQISALARLLEREVGLEARAAGGSEDGKRKSARR
jgi:hypothetical protein